MSKKGCKSLLIVSAITGALYVPVSFSEEVGPWLTFSWSDSGTAENVYAEQYIQVQVCLSTKSYVFCGGDSTLTWTDKSKNWRLEVTGYSSSGRTRRVGTSAWTSHEGMTCNNIMCTTPAVVKAGHMQNYEYELYTHVKYRWVKTGTASTPPVGVIYLLSRINPLSGSGGEWAFSGGGAVIPPPVPEVSCTASRTNLDLAHGTINVNKPSTTREQNIIITCTEKTYPDITVNGVKTPSGKTTRVPVSETDKVSSSLDTTISSYAQGDNGVTSVNMSSTVLLKQAGQYNQAVPLVFSIP